MLAHSKCQVMGSEVCIGDGDDDGVLTSYMDTKVVFCTSNFV